MSASVRVTRCVGIASLSGIARSDDPAQLGARIARGDRAALARGLSLIERGDAAGRELASVAWTTPGVGYIVGITGAPGAGKSTLTDRLVREFRRSGDPVAVLAVDPSSPFSGGAILGDSVRMSDHFLDPGVFIRSMASRGALGGLALAVPEAVRLLDAAGFAWIVVETVGVGQVEVDIASAADTTVVVMNPGWGDAVQANKAGLLEVADILVVNKADRPGAADTEADLLGMLSLRSTDSASWRPPVLATSATEGTGIDSLVEAIARHRAWQQLEGHLLTRRRRRIASELQRLISHEVAAAVEAHLRSVGIDRVVDRIETRELSLSSAAAELRPQFQSGPE